MNTFTLLVLLMSVFTAPLIRGNLFDAEDVGLRAKRHFSAGHSGGRPTYGGFQNVAGYQQQQQQPHHYYNQRFQSSGGESSYRYQQPNSNQGLGNMKSYNSYQQPGQNYQPSSPAYQPGFNGNTRYQQYDYHMAG